MRAAFVFERSTHEYWIQYCIVFWYCIVSCSLSTRVRGIDLSLLRDLSLDFVLANRDIRNWGKKKKTKLASKMIDFQTTINVIRPQCITFEIMVNCFFTEGIWSDVSSKLLKRVWISTTMKKALTYGSWHQAGLPVRLNAKVGNITTLPFTNVKTI